MEISFSKSFKKVFNKKIKGTDSEPVFWKKVELFIADPIICNLGPTNYLANLKACGVFQ